MSDAFQNMLAGFNAGTQLKRQRESDQRERQFNALAEQAYQATGPQREQAVGRAIGVDAAAGMALDRGLQDFEMRRNESVANAAKLLVSAPEEYRQSVYQQIRPGLIQYIPDMPEQYDGTVAQAAQAISDAYFGGGQQGVPADIRTLQMLRDDPELLELEERRRKFGWKPTLTTDADNNRVFADPKTNQYSSIGAAGMPSAPSVGSGALDPVTDFQNLAGQFGAQVSSLRRDPQRNEQVGGVKNSYHLSGEAGDFVVPPENKAAFIDAAKARGYQVKDEVDHIHVEPPRRGMTSSQFAQGQRLQAPKKASGSTDFERRVAMAREYGASDEDVRRMAMGSAAPDQAKSATGAEIEEATARRMKRPQIANLERGIQNIENALTGLSDNMIGTGPMTGPGIRLTREGQALETSVGAIQESLLSLTRVPGIGAQSDLEARIAALKYPQVGNYAENNAMLIQNLRAIVSDIKEAYDSLQADDDAIIASRSRAPQGAQQQRSAQRQIKRTGTLNGRKVVQYTDGATEYAD